MGVDCCGPGGSHVGGPSPYAAFEDKKYEKRKKKRQKRERDQEQDKGVKNLWLAVLFLALMCGGGIMTMLPALDKIWQLFKSKGYTKIKVNDKEQLEDVFFGGFPWLLLCRNDSIKSGVFRPRFFFSLIVDCFSLMDFLPVSVSSFPLEYFLEILSIRYVPPIWSEAALFSSNLKSSEAISLGVIDCFKPMPSGKSVIERFNIPVDTTK